MKAKRILSMLLAGLMVAGMSVSAFANETEPKPDDSTTPTQETQNEAPEGDYSVMPLGTPDETAPTLVSVSMEKSKVAPGGTIDVTLKVSDDISGVDWAQIQFINEENGREIEAYCSVEPTTENIVTLTLNIDKFEPNGEFELDWIYLKDVSGNNISYSNDREELPNMISFVVSDAIAEMEDNTKPILKSILLDTDTIEASKSINVTLSVSDTISGVDWAQIQFINEENGREIKAYCSVEPIMEGTITLTLDISEFEPNGTFELDWIYITDMSGNKTSYHSWPNDISFQVTNVNNEKVDDTVPMLHTISIDEYDIETMAPGAVNVTLSVSDTISGVDWAQIQFINADNGREIEAYCFVEPIMEGTITLTLEVNEFEPSGLFELDWIYLKDASGNRIHYGIDKEFPNTASFIVVNSVDTENGDIVTSTNNSKLAEDVDQMGDGNTAYIYYGNDATLDEEVFDAVADTDKKLVLSSDGIQWEFDGKTVDADKAKDLELDVDIERDRRSDSENADEIEEALGTKNSIIVSFPENGELPGPAKIRIKMDHVFRNYIDYEDGKATVYVYYYDNTTGEFVEVASNLTVGSDEYLEFTITHNSDFVIMNGAYVKPEDKPDDNTNNKPTWTPSYDDDEDEDVVVLEDDKEKITVEEFANGTVKANRKSASKGQKVTLTVTPDDDYVLKSLTVTNSKGKEVEVTEKNGKYYFEMPSTKVSIDAEFVKANVTSVEKTNPETGAGDVVDVSVAFAVCSVICGAVLVSKKR